MKNSFEYEAELAALREENERLKSESFEELYNAVIDDRDALREELATVQRGKDNADLALTTQTKNKDRYKQRAFAAEQRNSELETECEVQRESKEQWEKVAGDWVNKAQVFSTLMQEFCDRVDRGEVRSKSTYAKFKSALNPTESGAGDKCTDCQGVGQKCMHGHSAHPDNWYDCETCKGGRQAMTHRDILIMVPKGCACQGVTIGGYENQVELPTPQFMQDIGSIGCLTFRDTTCIDRCVAPLVQALWERGVVTTGACCGHNIRDGYIGIYESGASE